jgi:hypothetical protein
MSNCLVFSFRMFLVGLAQPPELSDLQATLLHLPGAERRDVTRAGI